MSYRTNRRTRGTFKLSGKDELEAKLRDDLKLIGRPDRYETLSSAITQQINKATDAYEHHRTADQPDISDASAAFWTLIAGGGPEGMRSSKPKDGRAAYIWRMLRFHTGVDVHMPVMADFDVDREVDTEYGIDYYLYPYGSPEYISKRARHDVYYPPDNNVKAYSDENPVYATQRRERKRLDAIVEYILAYQYPVNQFKAALRWQGVLG